MTRFLVDIAAEEIRKLDEIARREGKSRAAVLREAVANYLDANGGEGFEKYFGLWARHGIMIDPHQYDREHRAEEIRPVSPDVFDEYDEKERAHYLALVRKAAAKHKMKPA
jgi:Ribbon-helix-helix protein, copG family